MKIYPAILLMLLILNADLVGAQELRTLFSTPQQRAELDRLRDEWVQGLTDALQVVESEMAPAPEIVALGGVVMRSNQSFVVWLNGIAVDEEDLPENMRLSRNSDQVSLIAAIEGKGDVLVKPGQSVNLTTGETRESFDLTQEQIDEVRGIEVRMRAEQELRALPVSTEEDEDADDAEESDPAVDADTASSILNVLDALQEARQLQESLQ